MAKIQTNVSESVFFVKRWRGVNEAEEGEAALKNGEGAVCRNFRVTSGGALKKRNGSKNVAGLISGYTATTGQTEKLIAEKQGSGGFTAYSQLNVDSVGMIHGAGTSAEAYAENADTYAEYYVQDGDNTFELIRADVTAAEGGTEAVTGGRLTPKSYYVAFASGTDSDKTGSVEKTGTVSIDLYPTLRLFAEGDHRPYGTKTVTPHSSKTSAGFDTEAVGGWVKHEGAIYKYYGAKTERYDVVRLYKKYAATAHVDRVVEFYYEGSWNLTGSGSIRGSAFYDTGYSSYSFDESTGVFTEAGSPVILYAGDSGTIYYGYGSTITKRVYTAVDANTSSYRQYTKTAKGPYRQVFYYYTLGEELTGGWGRESNPGAYEGYTFVQLTDIAGTQYKICKDDGGNYYAYTYDTTDTSERYDREFAFYGYPISAYFYDTAKWYGYPVTAEPNASTDTEVRTLWSGFVAGSEVIVAACNGHLWELTLTDGEWSKASCGTIDTTGRVEIFGFDGCAYILTDTEYKVWNGTTLREVEGYIPLVSVANPPAGGGTLLEQVNKLTGKRRAWYSPDGTAATFQLPETNVASIDAVKSTVTGEAITNWKSDAAAGTVTFGRVSTGLQPWIDEPPAAGTNTIEITWTAQTSYRSQVIGMKCAELYNGAQDTRVFLYGDASNKAIYSGLDYDGNGRADYFPDLNEAAVGDENTPVTALIRHYDRLLCFKADSAWSISYSTITLADGSTTAGFYVVPVNRDIGSCALGEARLVENRPRTLDGRSVIEWRTASGGYLTADQRNAERISQRVEQSIRNFDLTTARTFYDKINHEYYVIGANGDALVNSVDADAWYIYTGFDARCMIVYQDEVYYGDGDGNLRHFSADYFSDNGEAIDCLWESGAMDFSQDFRRKYSAMIWVGIKPEEHGYLEASAETDRKTDFADYEVERDDAGAVPEMTRLKIKAKKFTYYKLVFKNETADTTATVVSADIRVRSTGYVR